MSMNEAYNNNFKRGNKKLKSVCRMSDENTGLKLCVECYTLSKIDKKCNVKTCNQCVNGICIKING